MAQMVWHRTGHQLLFESMMIYLIDGSKGPQASVNYTYRQTYRRTKSQTWIFIVSSCSCFCPIYGQQSLSQSMGLFLIYY